MYPGHKRSAYWFTEAKQYRLEHDRAGYLEELRNEAMVELEKFFTDSPTEGYREVIDYDTFDFRIVTEYSDGHVVDMEMDELGPRPRVPLTSTHGMLWREAQNVHMRNIESQLNFLVNNAGREIKDPSYPARLVYQCTVSARSQKVATLPDLGPAKYVTQGEI